MKIDFSKNGGLVVFDDLCIDPSVPLEDQLDNLKEDMLQVEFKDEYVLDVGWRPSFDPNGVFKIVLIKNFDWENPRYSAEAKDIDSLGEQIESAMRNID